MSQNAYAKVGHAQPASTGWTSPTLIYEKMRQVNVSASALNSDINGNVTRQAFKGAWASWFANWSEFFKKYQGLAARMAAITFTDELFQQTLSYEAQLVTWYDAYGREKDGEKPVPPPSGSPPSPNVPIPPSKTLPTPPSGEGLSIPWWAWAIGAGMLAGAGYMTYRYVKRAQAIRAILDEKVVPQALQFYGGPVAGPQLAAGYPQFAAASRDPGASGYVMVPGANHMHAVQGGVSSVTPMPLPYSRYGV